MGMQHLSHMRSLGAHFRNGEYHTLRIVIVGCAFSMVTLCDWAASGARQSALLFSLTGHHGIHGGASLTLCGLVSV